MSPHYLVKLVHLTEDCFTPNVGGSDKSQFVMCDSGGSKKNRLWCLANWMSSKHCHSVLTYKVPEICT